MKTKNLIIILLSVIIVGMGCWIGYKYYQINYLFNNINQKSYSTKVTSFMIHRELNSEDWPVKSISSNGNTKLYIAEETSKDGKTQTLKIKIENLSNHELSGTITAEFLSPKDNNLQNSLNFAGRYFSLDNNPNDYYYFEYSVDVSDLTDEEKEATEFMISVCESGCMS